MTTKYLRLGIGTVAIKRPRSAKANLLPFQRWVIVLAGLLVFLILPTLLTLSSIGNIHMDQFGSDVRSSSPWYSEYIKKILG
jgi:hypothetical protein